MQKGEIPQTYDEIPDHRFLFGPAIQHENTTESAVEIVEWLAEQNIPAFASPCYKARGFAATVLIPESFDNQLAMPTDWILVDNDGRAHIFHDFHFRDHFKKPADTMPTYLQAPSTL